MKYGTFVRIPAGSDIAAVCEEKFTEIKNMGFDSCQLVYKPAVYNLEDADIIKASAEKHGIEISAQFAGFRDTFTRFDNYFDYHNAGLAAPAFRETRTQYVLSVIPFMKRLGITDMIVHAGPIPNNPFERGYSEMVCAVRVVAEALKRQGMNFLFETGGESPVTLLRIIQDIGLDNVFINLDTGNIIMYGFGNPVDAIYTFGKYVRNMHAKDGLPPTDPRALGKEVNIGEGHVDFEKVFAMLHDLGYDRFVTIEREIGDGAHAVEIARSMKYLKGIVDRQYSRNS